MSTDGSNATVVARRDSNARVVVVHVRPDGGDVPPFVPGQFVQLGLPNEDAPRVDASGNPGRVRLVKRSYSIASAPRELHAFELCVARVDGGKLTPRLFDLPVGGRLWCDAAPKGFFTLERVPRGRTLVCVATGTGIAPFVSMWREYRHEPGRFARFVVVHGARERGDLAYDAELRAESARDPRLAYVPILSREPDAAWTGARGRVQAALEPTAFARACGTELVPVDTHVLLCGNPQMIDDVRVDLAARGFTLDTPKTPGNVHFERYW